MPKIGKQKRKAEMVGAVEGNKMRTVGKEELFRRFIMVTSDWLCKRYYHPTATRLLHSVLFGPTVEEGEGDQGLKVNVEVTGSGIPVAYKVPIPSSGTLHKVFSKIAKVFWNDVALDNTDVSDREDPSTLFFFVTMAHAA